MLKFHWDCYWIYQLYNNQAVIVKQVGEPGPILDAMAVMLENISTITVIARTTISAVYRTAQIVASLPNLSYQNKASSIMNGLLLNCLSDMLSVL